ncbi:protein CHROMATIN REMODELING 35-like [Hordeum vulgare subsp. vulgare]|uniref:SNF2P n=1 Tax=Hordeum vulgare subsp. vulgare TaxID=112509 RepID=A0A8I6XT94_HORVV|nr:protein CHROMATIN REMODELING 35-like [Hordeum vulgare subsp. vulgare]
MDPTNCKRQKHEIGCDSSPSTQSLSTIISHNRSVRLRFLKEFKELKYGSVTEDYKAINRKRHELISTLEKLQLVPIKLPYASVALKSSNVTLHDEAQTGNNINSDNIIELDLYSVGYDTHATMDNTGAQKTVCLLDSDDEDMVHSFVDGNLSDSKQNNYFIQECMLAEQPCQYQDISSEAQLVVEPGKDSMDIDNEPKEIAFIDGHSTSEPQVIKQGQNDINIYAEGRDRERERREGEGEDVQSKQCVEKKNISVIDSYEISCEVIQSESTANGHYNHYDSNDNPVDDLDDLWNDMSIALACSKTIGSDHSIVPPENNNSEVVDRCHHDFLMKDDLGIVCRVCGLIQQHIESIFETNWKKRMQSNRTYAPEPRNYNDLEATTNPSGNILQVVSGALSIDPRHSEQMKPHQVEGFQFLIKNLADENNPGGCILAHAPGSGKTFMVISFVQSFLARYPTGRPLIILPKGIMATWRAEFLYWQTDEIPLYDFYSKGDNWSEQQQSKKRKCSEQQRPKKKIRSEQLKVLNMWEEKRSVLLLGYQQFAGIISDEDTSDAVAVMCREKLLKVPSLVILDEGHTPRNEQTNLLTALGSIRTPRKVVLSGTLFQNHVREVFNILNLVRPKFLKMEKSRAIVKRMLSKVDMLGKSARSKYTSDKYFYDVVEGNLKKDADDKMRVMIIQNLRELTADVLHYYKGELLDELPGLVDFTVFLNMSTEQEEILRSLMRLDNFSRKTACSAIYLHPCLKNIQNDEEKNRDIAVQKIDSIIKRGINIKVGAKAMFVYNLLCLSEAAGEKVLVFSRYLNPLVFLEMLLRRMKGWKPEVQMFKLNGKLTQEQRDKAVERFNRSADAKVLFGSIKACGEGISLVGASRVVILEVHENPSVTRQAIGRAFRPGQSKMVYCYRLVAADSPEEEDHKTALGKEWVSKMWFESNELCTNDDFQLASVDVSVSGDRFFESPELRQDVKSLHKR